MSENPDRSRSAKIAGSGWTRPQAMRKDQNRTAWLVFFGIACLGVATWSVFSGIYWKRRESVQLAALDMAKRESDSFVAIAYGGVTTNPEAGGDFVSTRKFASQLDALTAAGSSQVRDASLSWNSRSLRSRVLSTGMALMSFSSAFRSSRNSGSMTLWMFSIEV